MGNLISSFTSSLFVGLCVAYGLSEILNPFKAVCLGAAALIFCWDVFYNLLAIQKALTK